MNQPSQQNTLRKFGFKHQIKTDKIDELREVDQPSKTQLDIDKLSNNTHYGYRKYKCFSNIIYESFI